MGQSYWSEGKHLEKAKAYLVDFQIYCQMKEQKPPELLEKFKKASQLISKLMSR